MWDLRGRLTGWGPDGDADGTIDPVGRIDYTYAHDGLRVGKSKGGLDTHLLIDRQNPTGYAQVLEEKLTPTSAPTSSYLLGLDVIAQARLDGTEPPATPASIVQQLLYDGGGHTRGLLDATGRIADGQVYAYDGFGVVIQDPANPLVIATALQYRGEWTDIDTGRQYLRARWYEPDNGRFARLDPWGGTIKRPLTLNHYAFAHTDPINQGDPTGLFSTTEVLVGVGITSALAAFGGLSAYKAGVSPLRGVAFGLLAGGGLALAYAQGPKILGEAVSQGLLQGATAAIGALIGERRVGWNVTYAGFEGFATGVVSVGAAGKVGKLVGLQEDDPAAAALTAVVTSFTTNLFDRLSNNADGDDDLSTDLWKSALIALADGLVTYTLATKLPDAGQFQNLGVEALKESVKENVKNAIAPLMLSLTTQLYTIIPGAGYASLKEAVFEYLEPQQ